MRRNVLIFSCLLAVAFAAQKTSKIFPYAYTQEDLSNGLRLVSVSTGFPNIVSVYIVVQAGSRNEGEPGHTGFAHLFEHLMFKGTERYPQEKYNQTIRNIGAMSNAFTTEDYTCYYTTFSKEDLEAVLAMEADRFQNLKYTEPEFKTETLAVLGEYNKNASSPFTKLDEVVADTAFEKSTYKHTTMGFLKDIQDMPNQYDYSRKFFDRYYRPEYTTIVVAGDVRSKAVRLLVDKYWGGWKRGSYKPEVPQEPPQEAPRSAHVDWSGPTLPIVDIAFHGPAYDDATPDSAALEAAADLTFGPNSELYQKLVIEEQKADLLAASAPRNVDASLFEVLVRVKKAEDIESVRDRILAAVKDLQEKPVDAARLEALKKHVRYRAALRMDSSDAVASMLAPYIALQRTPETVNRFYQQFAGLKPEDLKAAAAKYLTDNRRTLVTLTKTAEVSQ